MGLQAVMAIGIVCTLVLTAILIAGIGGDGR